MFISCRASVVVKIGWSVVVENSHAKPHPATSQQTLIESNKRLLYHRTRETQLDPVWPNGKTEQLPWSHRATKCNGNKLSYPVVSSLCIIDVEKMKPSSQSKTLKSFELVFLGQQFGLSGSGSTGRVPSGFIFWISFGLFGGDAADFELIFFDTSRSIPTYFLSFQLQHLLKQASICRYSIQITFSIFLSSVLSFLSEAAPQLCRAKFCCQIQACKQCCRSGGVS